MRYRFFREHKYVSFMLTEFERKVGKTDFSSVPEVMALKLPLGILCELLKGHAVYEDTVIFSLLKNKGETLQNDVEKDHQQHEQYYQDFMQGLDNIIACTQKEERLQLGHVFYLSYRYFVAENLRHLHIEEAVIMPALQKHYTDEELSAVEAPTYNHMTALQMTEMMEHLFPHIDLNDKIFFLADIKKSQPEKFIQAWMSILPLLSEHEQNAIIEQLALAQTEPAGNHFPIPI